MIITHLSLGDYLGSIGEVCTSSVPSGAHSLAALPLMADFRSISECFKTCGITSLILETFL